MRVHQVMGGWGMVLNWVVGGLGVCLVVALLVFSPLAVAIALVAVAALVFVLWLPRGASACFALVGALCVLVFLPPSALSSVPLGSALPPSLALLILIVGVVKRGTTLAAPPGIGLTVGVFGLLMVSTLVMGEADPYYMLIGPVAVVAHLLAGNLSARERGAFFSALVWIAVAQAFLTFYEATTGVPVLGQKITMTITNPFIPGLDRVQGTLTHPLVLSTVLIAAFGIAITRRRRFWLVQSAVILPSLALTGSSTSVLAAGAIVVWVAVSARKPWARVFSTAVIVLVGALTVVGSDGFAELEDDLSGDNVQHRKNSIAAIPNLMFDQDAYPALFGNGMGSIERLYWDGVMIDDGFPIVDNQFATSLAQVGMVGALMLLALAVRAFLRADRTLRAVLIVFALISVSFDFIMWYPMAFLFFAVVGLSVPARPRRKPALLGADGLDVPRRAEVVLDQSHHSIRGHRVGHSQPGGVDVARVGEDHRPAPRFQADPLVSAGLGRDGR